MALKLRIVTPDRVVVDAEVSELTAPGTEGEFGVFPQHVTFLGNLDVGVLRYVSEGQTRSVVVDGGYAEVREDVVTILADGATAGEDIDAAAARESLQDAERALEAGDADPDQVAVLLDVLKRAEASVRALP